MKIQVNTDSSISGSVDLAQSVEDILKDMLGRFSDHITRIEVHLNEEGSVDESGSRDIRCMLEVRQASQQPVVVNGEGRSVDQAVSDAGKKMVGLLDSDIGRRAR